MKRFLCLFLALAFTMGLFAIDVNITKRSGSSSDNSQDIKVEITEFLDKVSDLEKLNTYLANTGAIMSRGLGVDYANTDFKYFMLGFSNTLAVTPGNDLKKTIEEFNNFSEGGDIAAIAPGIANSLTLGLDMHYVPVDILKDFKFYINVFHLNEKAFSSLIGPDSNVQFAATSFGLHFLYPVIKPISFKSKHLFYWGGINVSGGLDYVSNEISYSYTNTDPNIDARAELVNRIFTLPIEVSTNVRLLHIFSLFAGLGTDFNFGKAYVKADGTVIEDTNVYDLDVNFGKDGRPHFMGFRAFTGLEINLYVIHVMGKIEYSVFSKSLAAQVGFSLGY
ncbi:MAG: hypothetical protein P1P64_00975 [Treponemataceae bacterium]